MNARHALTVAMGCFIPMFSLSLSHVGGELAQHGSYALAIAAFAVMGCVLAVSLSHLAWAIEDITRSDAWAAWLLAIAFDCALVVGELVQVYARNAGVVHVTYAIMICVCILSMLLNCWAFLGHPVATAKAARKAATAAKRTVTPKIRTRKPVAPKIAQVS